MSYIVIPSRRTTQPLRFVGPARSALGDGVQVLLNPALGGDNVVDVVNGRLWTPTTVGVAKVVANGQQCVRSTPNDVDNGYYSYTGYSELSGNSGTFFLYAPRVGVADTNGHVFFGNSTAAVYFQVAIAAAGAYGWAKQVTGSNSDWYSGSNRSFVITSDGTTSRYYLNGAFINSSVNAPTSWPAGSKTLRAFGWSGTTWEPDADMSVLGYSSKVWPDALVAEFHRNPFGIYASEPRRLYFDAGAGGGGTSPVTVTPSEGHLSLTGYTPTLDQDRAIAPTTGHLALAGYAPGIDQDRSIAPDTGHLALAGYAPTITQSVTTFVNPTTGHLSLTGYAPGIDQDRTIAPTEGHLLLAGYVPVISQLSGSQVIAPTTGSIFLNGYTPSILQTAPGTGGSMPSFGGGGGGGRRWWKELGGDEKVDEIVREVQATRQAKLMPAPEKQKAPEPAVAPAAPSAPAPDKILARLDALEERIMVRLDTIEATNKLQLRRIREEIDAIVTFFGSMS